MNPKQKQAFLELLLTNASVDFTKAKSLADLEKLAKANEWDGVYPAPEPATPKVLKKIDWTKLGQTSNKREREYAETGIITSIIAHPTQPIQEMPSGDKIAKYQIRLKGISYGINVLATQIREGKQEDYRLYLGAKAEIQGVMGEWDSPNNGKIPVFNALEVNILELNPDAELVSMGATFKSSRAK